MCATTEDKKFLIDFIDPLFAVILHITFTHTVMMQPWFNEPLKLLSSDQLFSFFTLLLGYAVVVQSWLGYHESVKEKPIKAAPRFYIDIFLLLSYLMLLLKFDKFLFVLVMLVIIFVLFILWDMFKAKEYAEDYESRLRRKVTMFWFLVFLILLGLYFFINSRRGVFLAIAIVGILMYRQHKNKPWPKVIMDVLPVPTL